LWAKESCDTHEEENKNGLLNLARNGRFCKLNPASTVNFTLEQQEEEELGTNMTTPVGAPSYITPYLTLSSIDFNS